ncbi:pseudouridine synthase [Radiomyces spectabilis]|uniref:pseudouridine synthase n=1 Tax=Radiomyces spectabilis TaxID=64574 RepID=UPI00221FDE6A|nr:pseudouridine synthase [Radiomyces spectabilis]KAI8380891.1 pseudouridine synthase [Radiomyces spectabilis]
MEGSPYDQLTREELIERLKALEASQNTAVTDRKGSSKIKAQRPFDMSKYSQQHIALKVAYLGWNYLGFASQGNEAEVPTVEGAIFNALKTSRLIESPDKCNFSRCGRTDKGVSGLGQVVALDVRSNPEKEIPYIETINRLLPDDVRVLAWAPVPSTFNARFNCKSRTYKYFFTKGNLDLDAMRLAANYMMGEHDFRNFCKLDPSKNITNYHRTIVSLDIRPVHGMDTSSMGQAFEFYEVELKGTAFLWHQVRCIMSILFLVGQKLEAPEIVQELLDISRTPSRPDYPMASDLPLLLYDCEFEDINWIYASDNVNVAVPSPLRTHKHFHEMWNAQMIRGLMCQTFLRSIDQSVLKIDQDTMTLRDYMDSGMAEAKQSAACVLLGGGKEIRTARYKRLMDRQRADSDAVKKEKYEAKKKRKLA